MRHCFSKNMSNFESAQYVAGLEENLSYTFKNKSLLIEALTHRSYSHEQSLNYNYERLEFLGDAVLSLVISEYIIGNYKNFDEGCMSQLRAYVVNENFLSHAAMDLGIDKYVLLGKGEQASPTGVNSILADIFEAVIAAVYLDGGYEKAAKIVMSVLKSGIEKALGGGVFLDEKGEIQKFSQKYYGCLPVYTVKSVSGPDHDKFFTVELNIGGKLFSEGSGKSKKMAEKAAASAMLKTIPKG